MADPDTTADQFQTVDLWGCPDCGFEMDAAHEDTDGGWSCPVCEVDRLRATLFEMSHHSLGCSGRVGTDGVECEFPDEGPCLVASLRADLAERDEWIENHDCDDPGPLFTPVCLGCGNEGHHVTECPDRG